MNRTSKLLSIALAGMVLLSACQPAPTPTEAPTAAPTDTPVPPTATATATLTAFEQEQIRQEAYLAEHGFVALETSDPRLPYLAMAEGGEMLAPVMAAGTAPAPENLSGGAWMIAGETVVLEFGEDGLPASMFIEGYTLLFSNYTETTFDIAMYQGSELIEKVNDAALDAAVLQQFQALRAIAANPGSAHRANLTLSVDAGLDELATLFEIVGLGFSLVGCGVALTNAFTAWIAIKPCGSALWSAVTLITGEDFEVFGVPIPPVIFEVADCIMGGDLYSCTSAYVDSIALVLDLFDEVQEEHEDVYEKAFEPVCTAWFVYADLWPCGYSASGPTLQGTIDYALSACASSCGGTCTITQQYCTQTSP